MAIVIGHRFGRLVIEAGPDDRGRGHRFWVCRCECGREKRAREDHLRSGATRSCGCLRTTALAERSTTHGGTGTTEYNIWRAMRARCERPEHERYADYGGRGITVCERWQDFAAFLSDMGQRPPGRSLDRKDVNGDYEPNNCRWATYTQQTRNKRSNRMIEHDGQTHCVAEWAEMTGIGESTIAWRLSRGWPAERALTQAVRGAFSVRVSTQAELPTE